MNKSTSLEIGPTSQRKPYTAMNLSFLMPGLGQLYCGSFKRGILHNSLTTAALLLGIIWLTFRIPYPVTFLIIASFLLFFLSFYSAFDARRLARQCRPDYRLKDYNSLIVYIALAFLTFSLIVGFTFSLRENIFASFRMVGDSMSNTIQKGDLFIVRRDSYRINDPKHNDLIAFRNPNKRSKIWLKRVIALPGDTVAIEAGKVILNGQPLSEDKNISIDSSDFASITIPKNHCFVLGDNRSKSCDSRHIGPIPMNALIGKAITYTKK